eukprot:CAMPEP_0194520682 /NCGR_PEP_ID=MMETSP0253-20130528/54771_1 /TAXON_ID=2966 /ORGANISM="Noctiluca scintillans" /LENGTH=203 /DNA_ID=CAMNT_0039364953 /DNA_START=60 /DNA_END=672 /DNA_ORIENTATION=-
MPPLDTDVSAAEAAAKIEATRKGFVINWMNMRDAATGRVLWESPMWDTNKVEAEAHVKREILQCRQVAREINFSSVEMMQSLRLVQSVLFNGEEIEEWNFSFGFVIPNSTNTWQQTIESAEEEEMITAEVASGNIVIDTTFYEADSAIANQKIASSTSDGPARVLYDHLTDAACKDMPGPHDDDFFNQLALIAGNMRHMHAAG